MIGYLGEVVFGVLVLVETLHHDMLEEQLVPPHDPIPVQLPFDPLNHLTLTLELGDELTLTPLKQLLTGVAGDVALAAHV